MFDVFLPGAQAQRCEIPSELEVLTKLKTKHHLVTIGHTMLRYVIFHVSSVGIRCIFVMSAIFDLSCISLNDHSNLLKFHAHSLGMQVYGF